MPEYIIETPRQVDYDADFSRLLAAVRTAQRTADEAKSAARLQRTSAPPVTTPVVSVSGGGIAGINFPGCQVTPGSGGTVTITPAFSGLVKAAAGGALGAATAGTDYLAPGGTAGGDLSGTLPNPTVAKLQGRTMASTAPTSGQVLTWDGAQWEPADPTGGGGGGGGEPGQTPPTSPPTVAGGTWTEINFEGVATASDSLDGIVLVAPPVSGDDSRLLVRSVPGSTFTVTARVRDLLFTNAFATAGVCLRESGTDRIIRVVYQWGGLLVLDRLTAPDVSPTSSVTLENYGGSTGEDPEWFRLVNDGSNLKVYVSPDGDLWDQLHSETVGSWLTPDQYGIIANSNNTARRAAVRLISLQESTP